LQAICVFQALYQNTVGKAQTRTESIRYPVIYFRTFMTDICLSIAFVFTQALFTVSRFFSIRFSGAV
jgi:hypothetical protein